MTEDSKELLENAFDMHVHTAPSHFSRKFDDFEWCREMDKYGMVGSVIKTHFGSTTARADICNSHSGCKSKLFGSITLDWPVGGLNPYAVEGEMRLGGKIVWLPTFHSHADQLATHFKHNLIPAPGIRIIDDKGKIIPALYEILDIIKQYDGILATGHIGADEVYASVKAALNSEVKIVITHPEMPHGAPISMQKELTQKGAFVEKCWLNTMKADVSTKRQAELIKEIGAEHCILVTDLGQEKNISPAEGMGNFIDSLLINGISQQNIKIMVRNNPSYLLRYEV